MSIQCKVCGLHCADKEVLDKHFCHTQHLSFRDQCASNAMMAILQSIPEMRNDLIVGQAFEIADMMEVERQKRSQK